MGWEVEGRFKKEGTHLYLRLIHVAVWQKPTQHYKAVIFQLKISKLKKKRLEWRAWLIISLSCRLVLLQEGAKGEPVSCSKPC